MLVKRDKKEKKTQKVLAMKTRIAAIYAFEQETKKETRTNCNDRINPLINCCEQEK